MANLEITTIELFVNGAKHTIECCGELCGKCQAAHRQRIIDKLQLDFIFLYSFGSNLEIHSVVSTSNEISFGISSSLCLNL